MRVNVETLIIVLQTVRLSAGRDQFVVSVGCSLSRRQLLDRLDHCDVHAEHSVVQPETGREGSERLVALGSNSLTESEKAELRASLRRRLADVPSIIDEVEQQTSSSNGEMPQSQTLADWQNEIRRGLSVAHSNRVDSTAGQQTNRFGKLIVMLGGGMLLIAMMVMVPQIFNSEPGIGTREDTKINSSAVNYEGWNLTKSKEFSGEADLLKLLAPLVTPDAAKPASESSSQEQLADILAEINQLRLAQSSGDADNVAEPADARLQKLLADDALNAYVRKLIRDDGTFDSLGLVTNDANLESLRVLIPREMKDSSAVAFRRLAKRLTGGVAIGDSNNRIQQLENPFFDLAADHRDQFQVMIENIPREFKDVDSRCTFFTPDDCKAAEAIKRYFTVIGFLHGNSLGFTTDDPRNVRLNSYATSIDAPPSQQFARLLIQWKAFTEGSLRDAAAKQLTNDNPPVTNNP